MKLKKAHARLAIDPLVAALTPDVIQDQIRTFESLLAANSIEESVHAFLATHSYFFNSILRMFGVSPLYSKVRLGSTYEVDFAWFDT